MVTLRDRPPWRASAGSLRIPGAAVVTYLVDANVLSEVTKRTPDSRVVGWLRDNERRLAVDPVILGDAGPVTTDTAASGC